MGYTSYNSSSRDLRASSKGYFTKSVDETFEQQKKRTIHESMKPFGIKIREARDSEIHPNSLPIILSLDLTGSMGYIPGSLIKNGLPTLMTSIINGGFPDPAVLFLGIGDHKYDNYPLQVAQFESGDEELDSWLTKTYLEGGGGGNEGESYLLAWYFAAYHTASDAWDKRKQKGFLFTIGDEPCLKSFSKNFIETLMDTKTEIDDFSAKSLLTKAKEKYNVYHINLGGNYCVDKWKELIGEGLIDYPRDNYENVPKYIAELILKNLPEKELNISVDNKTEPVKPQIIL